MIGDRVCADASAGRCAESVALSSGPPLSLAGVLLRALRMVWSRVDHKIGDVERVVPCSRASWVAGFVALAHCFRQCRGVKVTEFVRFAVDSAF